MCHGKDGFLLSSEVFLPFSVKLDVVVVDDAVVSLGRVGWCGEGRGMEFGAGLDGVSNGI